MTRTQPNFIACQKPNLRDRKFGAWDIETDGLGGPFLQGWTWQGPGTEPIRHDTLDSLFKTLTEPDRGYTPTGKICRARYDWLAHNGAKYDFTYLAIMLTEYAEANQITIRTIPQGNKIIGLIIPADGGTVALGDTYIPLGSGLAAAARVFAPKHAKAGHCPDHDFTTDPAATFDPTCNTCTTYARQDVITLWHTYDGYRAKFITAFGIEPGMTQGVNGLRGWEATIPKGKVYYRQSRRKERWLRNFTTGAYITPGCTSRTLTPKPGQTCAAITADRCGAFAYEMQHGVYPTDAGIWTYQYEPGKLGFYEVDATCPPEDRQPVIPLSTGERRGWFTGTGRAYITSEQYEVCLRHRYELKVIKGLVFERTENIFETFIGRCEDLEYPRDGSPADPAIKMIIKGMRNALNGKFNIREAVERLYIGEPPDGSKPVIDEDTGLPLPLYKIEEKIDAYYTQPAWYALTVSRQQLEMIRIMDLLDPEERFKADTDSFTTTPERMTWLQDWNHITIGPGYGNYKHEHLWVEHRSLGPKNYYGVEVDGAYVANCKGIPQNIIQDLRPEHQAAGDGEMVPIAFTSLRTLEEMLATQQKIPAVRRTRSIGRPDSVIGWRHDGRTKQFTPIHIGGRNDSIGSSGEIQDGIPDDRRCAV